MASVQPISSPRINPFCYVNRFAGTRVTRTVLQWLLNSRAGHRGGETIRIWIFTSVASGDTWDSGIRNIQSLATHSPGAHLVSAYLNSEADAQAGKITFNCAAGFPIGPGVCDFHLWVVTEL